MQGQGQSGIGCLSALNHLPSWNLNEEKPSASPLPHQLPAFARSFASDVVATNLASGVTIDTIDGLPATVYATKNPTPNIVYDNYVHQPFPVGDSNKRAFTYFVLTGGRFIYASAARLLVLKFILSMTATKDVLAMANLEVDLGKIPLGQTVTVKWRGKPVFIRHRTAEDIAKAEGVDWSHFRDPQPDSARVQKPEWLIVVGVCTHLGCVPLANAGDYSGFFCPCHGTHYDTSGRVRRGPAPYNLEVPTYTFLEEDKVLVG